MALRLGIGGDDAQERLEDLCGAAEAVARLVELSQRALGLRPKSFVAVAGYGDITPGYLCTDEAHAQGGYEPSAAYGGVGTETALKKVIQELLGQ